MAEPVSSQSGKAGCEVTLENKVAMLFDGADEDGRFLAMTLANYGADIAIVYREDHARYARETKTLVEAKGRRCLIVPLQAGKDVSRDLIRQTASELGRLDIFIDGSSLSPAEARGLVGAEGEARKQQ